MNEGILLLFCSWDRREQAGIEIPEFALFEKQIEVELLNQNELVDERQLLEGAVTKTTAQKAKLRKDLLQIQNRRNMRFL